MHFFTLTINILTSFISGKHQILRKKCVIQQNLLQLHTAGLVFGFACIFFLRFVENISTGKANIAWLKVDFYEYSLY